MTLIPTFCWICKEPVNIQALDLDDDDDQFFKDALARIGVACERCRPTGRQQAELFPAASPHNDP